MEWDEFDAIIQAANLQNRLYCEDWIELERVFNEWKKKKDEEIDYYDDIFYGDLYR